VSSLFLDGNRGEVWRQLVYPAGLSPPASSLLDGYGAWFGKLARQEVPAGCGTGRCFTEAVGNHVPVPNPCKKKPFLSLNRGFFSPKFSVCFPLPLLCCCPAARARLCGAGGVAEWVGWSGGQPAPRPPSATGHAPQEDFGGFPHPPTLTLHPEQGLSHSPKPPHRGGAKAGPPPCRHRGKEQRWARNTNAEPGEGAEPRSKLSSPRAGLVLPSKKQRPRGVRSWVPSPGSTAGGSEEGSTSHFLLCASVSPN